MSELQTATLGGGCYWCLEAVFENLEGVTRVVSGFAGGNTDHPSYEDVCSGRTGHAEVVHVTFDAAVISYREVLEIFFAFHDPTTLNRQGPDRGTQYRSVILWETPEQRDVAEGLIRELETAGIWPDPIVTERRALDRFHPAEAYHQGYYRRNAEQPYCQLMINPKLEKLRRHYAARLKPETG